jgi:hypothetical protein
MESATLKESILFRESAMCFSTSAREYKRSFASLEIEKRASSTIP